MGKKIDEFVLGAAAAAGLYFYFQHAFSNRWVAALLALLGFVVLKKAFGMLAALICGLRCVRRRKLRRSAGNALVQLALLPEDEARERIEALLRRCYEGEYTMEVIPGHPALKLRGEHIFESWRAHRGEKELALCTLCRADEEVRSLAACLKEPRIAIVDADILGRLIAEQPEGFSFTSESCAAVKLKARFQQLLRLLFNRRNSPRNLLLAASMLAMYVLTARTGYLAAAIMLLFLALASLRVRAKPARLF